MKTNKAYFNEINVTPLTDVFLVLLVVMMLVTPLMSKASINVNPPGQGKHQTGDKRHLLTADISKNGAIRLNGQEVTPATCENLQRVIEKAKKANEEKKDFSILISADDDAKQQSVVTVMDAAIGAGIKSVSFQCK